MWATAAAPLSTTLDKVSLALSEPVCAQQQLCSQHVTCMCHISGVLVGGTSAAGFAGQCCSWCLCILQGPYCCTVLCVDGTGPMF